MTGKGSQFFQKSKQGKDQAKGSTQLIFGGVAESFQGGHHVFPDHVAGDTERRSYFVIGFALVFAKQKDLARPWGKGVKGPLNKEAIITLECLVFKKAGVVLKMTGYFTFGNVGPARNTQHGDGFVAGDPDQPSLERLNFSKLAASLPDEDEDVL